MTGPIPARPDWIARWQRIARRIRVPLGFAVAALYVFELLRHPPKPEAIAWSLALVVPGVWLRGYASGYVKKNQELTTTGPYAHVRNPLYLGSMSIAAGFAVAAGRWWLALLLIVMFLAIYVPTILSEEEFLRGTFPHFEEYAQRVPRLLPRLTPARFADAERGMGRFSTDRYRHHREYNASIGAAALYIALMLRMWLRGRF